MKLSAGALMFWMGLSWCTTTQSVPFMFACLVWAFLGGWLVDSALADKVKR